MVTSVVCGNFNCSVCGNFGSPVCGNFGSPVCGNFGSPVCGNFSNVWNFGIDRQCKDDREIIKHAIGESPAAFE